MSINLDDLNNAVAARGGRWLKLRYTQDPPIDGEIVAFESRDKRDIDGNISVGKKSGKPRTEWVFTVKTALSEDAEDDGLRKFSANESMQSAIARAIKESGKKAEVGGRLQVAVSADPADKFSQSDYQAKYTPPTDVGVPTDDIFG